MSKPYALDVKRIMNSNYAAKTLTCEHSRMLVKADIPELEAEILLLTPDVARIWKSAAEDVLSALLTRTEVIAELRGREFNQDFIVSALMSLIIGYQPANLPAALIFGAADRIIELAAQEFGTGTIDLRFFQLREGIAADLSFWTTERLRERAPAVRAAIVEWLNDTGESPLEGRESAEVLLSTIAGELEDPNGAVAEVLVDSWAYRSFNYAIIVAASVAGVTELEIVNNPPIGPDENTTPFCRAVHGTVLSTQVLEQGWRAYNAAVERRDISGAKNAAPLLSAQEARLERGGAETLITEKRLGPPPYHRRCRTRLRARGRTSA